MTLTHEQLEALVARELSGARLREARPGAEGSYLLLLDDGERLTLQLYGTGEEATAAATALRMLRGEVETTFPLLRAADETGAAFGTAYILTSEIIGEPLAKVLPRLSENLLYDLGRRLGELVSRMHRLGCPDYGALTGDDPDSADDERAYVLARLDRDLRLAHEMGLLDRASGDRLRDWFYADFRPFGRKAALVHGDLSPETILLRYGEGGWRISALTSWEYAMGWAPAWDHVLFLDAAYHPRYFAFRAGYGNGYDDLALRAYEQVRDLALAPYRTLLALRSLREARAYGDLAATDRYRAMLLTMLRLLAGDG
jgi:aminoglycoside phosphotransferase (APT) family kinase protein